MRQTNRAVGIALAMFAGGMFFVFATGCTDHELMSTLSGIIG